MKKGAGEPSRKPWQAEGSAFDPAPTRPVMRSELQRETGEWPIDAHPVRHDADGSGDGVQDASVVDLAALRRKRAADAPAGGIRRVAKPRRIDQDDKP